MKDYESWFSGDTPVKTLMASASQGPYKLSRDRILSMFDANPDQFDKEDLKALVGLERAECERHRDEKKDAYLERMMVVAFLSKIYPSVIGMDGNGCPVVYVESPVGQLSWHIFEDRQLPYFAHLPTDPTHKWDGHTTEEKYAKMAGFGKHVEPPEPKTDIIDTIMKSMGLA